jgi:hypothetical protein
MTIAHRFDHLLRAALHPRANLESVSTRTLALLIALGGAFQGACMGAFAFSNGGSGWFVLFSTLKVPFFLALAAGMCVPVMRVLYSLWGMGHEWPRAVRALASGQAAFAAILASLAPFTLVFYASGASYRGALMWNVALFALAGIAAQGVVRARLGELLQSEARHAKLWKIGFALWCFVAIQLAWNLRPFVGSPDVAPAFLRSDAFTNAYVGLWNALAG